MKTIADQMAESPLFQNMLPQDLQLIAGCGMHKIFNSGDYLARENDSADNFYLIHKGQVAIEIFFPDRGALTLQTLQESDIVGWAWLFPPYRWSFDIRARSQVHTTVFDGRCLRQKCAEDNRLGYDLMQRFAAIMTDRLQATRLQLVDLYSHQQVNPA